MLEILFKDEAYKIVGAAFEVYNNLGSGFLEPVYQEALSLEFKSQNIPFQPQVILDIYYKDLKLEKHYIPDFICFGDVIVEIKAIDKPSGKEMAQMINYLKATKSKIGILLNFGNKSEMEWKRVVN